MNYGVYGARKVWLTLNRERAADAAPIARCTMERLMGELGLAGVVRGKVKRTTISDPKQSKPLDLVDRNFRPLAPNRLWVADFTYCSTWSGWCYTAFVIDAYVRRILGWSVATTMTSQLVVDAVAQAIWTRGRDERDLAGLVAHHDHGTQYLSVAYSEKLDAAGIKPSTGAVGSSYDNALAESTIGLYKTELVKKQRPWKGLDDLEIATAEWVDWYNHRRPHEYCDDLTPVEAEAAHSTLTTRPQHPLESQTRKSPDSPGRFTPTWGEPHSRAVRSLPIENRVLLAMERALVLPPDFHDYAWEVEAKGVFWDGSVRLGDVDVAVTFYDPVRLAQDVTDELAERSTFELRRVLVVPLVTEEHMRAAVDRAPMEFFR